MENVIEVCDVNKYFGEEHVLKSVFHTFEREKFTELWVTTVPARLS